MKSIVSYLMISLLVVLGVNCSKESSDNGGGGAASDSSGELAGSLSINVTPKEGADSSTVANANLVVESHPEISATTDSSGIATV